MVGKWWNCVLTPQGKTQSPPLLKQNTHLCRSLHPFGLESPLFSHLPTVCKMETELLGPGAPPLAVNPSFSSATRWLPHLPVPVLAPLPGPICYRIATFPACSDPGALRRRGWQRMRWVDSSTDSINKNLSKLREIVQGRGAWRAIVHEVSKRRTPLGNKTTPL